MFAWQQISNLSSHNIIRLIFTDVALNMNIIIVVMDTKSTEKMALPYLPGNSFKDPTVSGCWYTHALGILLRGNWMYFDVVKHKLVG